MRVLSIVIYKIFDKVTCIFIFKMCECETAERAMDIKTPRNVYLSAFYKRSFAYYTVKNRMPVILTSLIDSLARNKAYIIEEHGDEAKEELKYVIGEISEFKYEIQTNKPLKLLTSEAPDAHIYNEYIRKQATEEGHPTHYHTIWLLTECYMYRRIREIFEKTNSMKTHDPFRNQKQEAYKTSLPLINQLGQYLSEIVNNSSNASKNEFISFLKLNLWGNKCDLSLSLGKVAEHTTLFDTASLDPYILCDHSEAIWNAISGCNSSDIIDFVFDNSGYEIFTDLCLADYMISKNLAKQVRFYVKTIPWFISDVMSYDFNWTIEQLKNNENPILKELGDKWSSYVENETWIVIETDFWTLAYDFTYMAEVDPKLYKQLGESKMAIFKGDLNYRKLFGEFNWDPVTPVDEALQNFHPTPLCILRTIKADIVCGLRHGIAEKIEAQDPKWMETGEWALIQFSDKLIKLDCI